MTDYKWFADRNSWTSVSEMPGLPYPSWTEFRQAILDNKVGLAVNYPLANAIAPLLDGGVASVWKLIAVLPLYGGIGASVALAFYFHDFAFLWGIVWAVAGFFAGSPVAQRSCSYISLLWLCGIIGCVIAAVRQWPELGFSCGVFVVAVWFVGAYYGHNARLVQEGALADEAFFIYAWHHKLIVLIDQGTGESILLPKGAAAPK